MRYSSVENWSIDTYNLNTKRAIVQKNASMEWVGGNLGSGTTMLYPASVLLGAGGGSVFMYRPDRVIRSISVSVVVVAA